MASIDCTTSKHQCPTGVLLLWSFVVASFSNAAADSTRNDDARTCAAYSLSSVVRETNPLDTYWHRWIRFGDQLNFFLDMHDGLAKSACARIGYKCSLGFISCFIWIVFFFFSVFFLVGFRSVLSLQVYAIKYYTWTIFLIGVHSRWKCKINGFCFSWAICQSFIWNSF